MLLSQSLSNPVSAPNKQVELQRVKIRNPVQLTHSVTMSTAPSRVFKGSRVLLEAAKAATKPSSSTTTAASRKKAASTTTTARSKSTTAAAKQSRASTNRTSGIFKLAPVSPALGSFLGVPETRRSDAVKKVWDYIKLHDLQNPANKKEVYCDDKLKTLFEGKEKVEFVDIGRMVSRHFVKTTQP